jgi:hypothetical protein
MTKKCPGDSEKGYNSKFVRRLHKKLKKDKEVIL